MDRKDELMIEALKTTLNEHAVKNYCINDDLDECYCLANENEQWITYVVDRGKRYDIESFHSLYEACVRMIFNAIREEKEKASATRDFILYAFPEIEKQRA